MLNFIYITVFLLVVSDSLDDVTCLFPVLVHVTHLRPLRRARHFRQVEDIRSNVFFAFILFSLDQFLSKCACQFILHERFISSIVFQDIMSTSLISAWKKNIFANPFQAACENGENPEAEPLAVNETRTIAAASTGLLSLYRLHEELVIIIVRL